MKLTQNLTQVSDTFLCQLKTLRGGAQGLSPSSATGSLFKDVSTKKGSSVVGCHMYVPSCWKGLSSC